MAYIAATPESDDGKVIGTGQCVAFVQKAAGAPLTANWRRGKKVKGDRSIQAGTAIATFSADGRYTNSQDGTSHAAIYVSQDVSAIQVWDQWKGQTVHRRGIRFQGGSHGAAPRNDGDSYHVID